MESPGSIETGKALLKTPNATMEGRRIRRTGQSSKRWIGRQRAAEPGCIQIREPHNPRGLWGFCLSATPAIGPVRKMRIDKAGRSGYETLSGKESSIRGI